MQCNGLLPGLMASWDQGSILGARLDTYIAAALVFSSLLKPLPNHFVYCLAPRIKGDSWDYRPLGLGSSPLGRLASLVRVACFFSALGSLAVFRQCAGDLAARKSLVSFSLSLLSLVWLARPGALGFVMKVLSKNVIFQSRQGGGGPLRLLALGIKGAGV